MAEESRQGRVRDLRVMPIGTVAARSGWGVLIGFAAPVAPDAGKRTSFSGIPIVEYLKPVQWKAGFSLAKTGGSAVRGGIL